MKKLFELLATHGGKIVSTNDLNTDEINQARASNRMYVDEYSLGYVWLPPFHGRFPVTVSEVEMFEWCYPLEVEIPKECSFENVLLSAVVYQSDGRIFNYLSKVKPPMNKHIFIHTKDDEVISCTARKTDGLEFHFREFKGYAEEHEVVGWSFPQQPIIKKNKKGDGENLTDIKWNLFCCCEEPKFSQDIDFCLNCGMPPKQPSKNGNKN